MVELFRIAAKSNYAKLQLFNSNGATRKLPTDKQTDAGIQPQRLKMKFFVDVVLHF